MVFKRAMPPVIWPLMAQAGVFVLGGFGWLALTRGLYASALVCGLGAVTLAWLGLSHSALVLGRDRLKRSQPGAIFTAELSRRRLQVLLDQTPAPLLLQPDNGQLIAVNRAARNLFDVSYALPVAARRALLDDTSGAAPLGTAGMASQIKWKGQTFAVHIAEMEEADHLSHLAVLTDISADVRAAEANALRDLLKVLNHELMNALTPVALDEQERARPAGRRHAGLACGSDEGAGTRSGAHGGPDRFHQRLSRPDAPAAARHPVLRPETVARSAVRKFRGAVERQGGALRDRSRRK
ncbi:MAG: hypothetical protein NVV72_08995 [Asticcacaulis sp.]|nr:hypothetical protein [Asticcacaulis sp.]